MEHGILDRAKSKLWNETITHEDPLFMLVALNGYSDVPYELVSL